MSNLSYDSLFGECMTELGALVRVEDPTAAGDGAPPPAAPPPATVRQAYAHYASMYVRYVVVLAKLERYYDGVVHPQKREESLATLELVARRVVELRHSLVRWNPPNPDASKPTGKDEPERPFAWEHLNLDEAMTANGLSPADLDTVVPRYFVEARKEAAAFRDKHLANHTRLAHGVATIGVGEDATPAGTYNSAGQVTPAHLELCVLALQRLERGRQGREDALAAQAAAAEKVRQARETANEEKYGPGVDPDAPPKDLAAVRLQRLARGFVGRRLVDRRREDEAVFLGMKPRRERAEDKALAGSLEDAYAARKQAQAEHKMEYDEAKVSYKIRLHEVEGPPLRDEMREERMLWVTDAIAEAGDANQVPENLNAFYDQAFPEPKPDYEALALAAAAGKGKKDDKKAGKDKKPKKGEYVPPPPPEEPPPLQGRTELTDNISKSIVDYADRWEERDERGNFAQRFDEGLLKEALRPDVEAEVREMLDGMLVVTLAKLKLQLAKGKVKKPKKPKKKKAPKVKKPKVPGDKIARLKPMDVDEMLGELVRNQLVNTPRKIKLDELIGDNAYAPTGRVIVPPKVEEAKDPDPPYWRPGGMSMKQLRAAIVEYCILPNGSANIKASLSPAHRAINAVMLYGPKGVGKTALVEAVATELGATFINMSPARLPEDLYAGKKGCTELLQLIWCAARGTKEPHLLNAEHLPVVVYLDQCDQMFPQTKKVKPKPSKNGPMRFKKDLVKYKKLFLDENFDNKHYRVLFVGCSNEPERGNPKDLLSFFDKFLYVPPPDYGARGELWRHFVAARVSAARAKQSAAAAAAGDRDDDDEAADGGAVQNAPPKAGGLLDDDAVAALAHLSEGVTGGEIEALVADVLTDGRVMARPIDAAELLDALGTVTCAPTFAEERKLSDDRFYEFTCVVGKLAERRKLLAPPKEPKAKKK